MEKERKTKSKKIIDSEEVEIIKHTNNIKTNIMKHERLVYSVITFMICLILFGLFYKFYLKELAIETTKIEKDVTVTDTGIADAVEKVYDSVVIIETYVNNNAYATGTGFVFKTDNNYGYLLTNSHVIENADQVYVTLTNNEKIKTEVVGKDSYSDIAVLKIDKDKVIGVASIGNNENMRVGDTTFTVGAPIDSSVYSWSITRGVLSGKNRIVEVKSNNSSNYVMEVLQTDAAINNGNSGGPLCNSNGEVIGITNMKLSSTTIEGMGFAIPIETATLYANSIISGKSIPRPYLGVSIYDAQNSFYSVSTGIYIDTVESGSAADKAGLKKGDKILKVGEKEVSNTSYFKYELYKYDIGDKVKITIERDGKEKVITATLKSNSKLN